LAATLWRITETQAEKKTREAETEKARRKKVRLWRLLRWLRNRWRLALAASLSFSSLGGGGWLRLARRTAAGWLHWLTTQTMAGYVMAGGCLNVM